SLSFKPIGFIRTDKRAKFDAPPQPGSRSGERNIIELASGQNFEQALKDLEGFDRIWLLWWFDRNKNWKPQVRPPRGGKVKRGVFATRSPYRPNPIGLTAVELFNVKGRSLVVGETDLVDGTPILDIKPYLPQVDAFPEANPGWVSELERELAERPRFEVQLSPLAAEQLEWLHCEWGIDFFTRAQEILIVDPSPNRTRRIWRHGKGYRMGCSAWRIFYSLSGKQVIVDRIGKGFAESALKSRKYTRIPDRKAQLAFGKKWP
ncbi:MAG: tRNA (N6-threonylcarbamoyladenosine(37)-N6)-methyltransferase TrmO, partial [Oligoflexia bacterium]|nr:tRNA (N6-threonylcarbamoyladenosine(37)-N6)-methyltransferase TrmO [Oligoflexia bacterium]